MSAAGLEFLLENGGDGFIGGGSLWGAPDAEFWEAVKGASWWWLAFGLVMVFSATSASVSDGKLLIDTTQGSPYWRTMCGPT